MVDRSPSSAEDGSVKHDPVPGDIDDSMNHGEEERSQSLHFNIVGNHRIGDNRENRSYSKGRFIECANG